MHACTHAQALERTAIAGVDWPSGVPGFFPVGRSIMGRWKDVLFIYLFRLFAAPQCFSVNAVKNVRDCHERVSRKMIRAVAEKM